MSSKGVSPSTIDCICCSLGAMVLLWISTLASALGDPGDVDGIVVARITLIYEGSPFDAANPAAPEPPELLIEQWRLNDRPLAAFRRDKKIIPQLETWPLPLADGSEGRGSFGPDDEEASESVRFVSLTPLQKENGQYAWTRVISTQQRWKGESIAVEIDFDGNLPVDVEVSVTMNGTNLANKNEAKSSQIPRRLQIVADGETATVRPQKDGR